MIQNLAAQLVPCPLYATAANLLQQKTRLEVSAGLIASGETVTHLVLLGDEEELWAVTMRSMVASAVTPRYTPTAKRQFIPPSSSTQTYLSGSLIALLLETYHSGKFFPPYLLDCT